MNKKLLIATIVALVLLAAGYWYWRSTIAPTPEEQTIQKAEDNAKALTESATQGVLPSLDVANPVSNLPDTNPVNKTNPFSNVKTNPFQ